MPLRIILAVYGTNQAGNDVTSVCQNLVYTGNDDIAVNNTAMQGDPHPGFPKYFGIYYEVDGRGMYRAGKEGDTIDLVP
jgi:hypothetical protein